MTDRYAVVGNPVAHSRSPEIHAAFARQTGQDMSYERVFAPLDDFVGTIERFFAASGRGLNVTLPFKERAFSWVDEYDEFAGSAGAVNTIVRTAHGFRGSNTDGVGLVRDLEHNLGIVLGGRRILVLGAGGAVRGVIGPLLGCAPSVVVIAARNAARASVLIDRFEDPRLAVLGPRPSAFDVVINGTSAGTTGGTLAFDPRLCRGAIGYDMAYGAATGAFAKWARDGGARAVFDGLGMLIEQAAESFFLWRGIRPDSGAVLAALRAVT